MGGELRIGSDVWDQHGRSIALNIPTMCYNTKRHKDIISTARETE